MVCMCVGGVLLEAMEWHRTVQERKCTESIDVSEREPMNLEVAPKHVQYASDWRAHTTPMTHRIASEGGPVDLLYG